MLRDFWNRLFRRTGESTVEREAEREQMSPAERHFDEESIDDIKADTVVDERFGTLEPGEPSGEGGPPAS